MFDRLIVWGGCEGGLESHRHIHRAFFENARKLGIQSYWVKDELDSNTLVKRGTVVIAADIWAKNLRHHEGAFYVLHNFSSDHPVMVESSEEQILRLQVWTHDAFGEQTGPCCAYSREGRILFQPWGTDILAEEFMEPVFNPGSGEAVFVGAIWSEPHEGGNLGNEVAINQLRNSLRDNGLVFRHLTQVSVQENIDAVRSARLAPAIAGGWQVNHGYVPCRCFKHPSYGVAMFTNIPVVQNLFYGASIPGDSIEELVTNAIRLRKSEYEELVREQQKIAARYTYRESLTSIDRALEAGK
jgi:hypothetical protein